MSQSVLIHRQPSKLDPTVEVGVFLTKRSRNKKTGSMPQLMILRLDQHPTEAVRSGADVSICGHCKHRRGPRGRTCYVTVAHGPASIYKAWIRGTVPTVTLETAQGYCAGKVVRLGSYGDPAAIDSSVWQTVLAESSGHTGYTHQWQDHDLATVLMASVDSLDEYQDARHRGYRTFRVRTPDQPLAPDEIVCPASIEAGKRTTCMDCGLCDGSRGPQDQRKNIAIIAHGNGASHFVALSTLTTTGGTV